MLAVWAHYPNQTVWLGAAEPVVRPAAVEASEALVADVDALGMEKDDIT